MSDVMYVKSWVKSFQLTKIKCTIEAKSPLTTQNNTC